MSFVTEVPCLCFEIEKSHSGSFGLKIAGGIDQNSEDNPFIRGDSGIFLTSIEENSPAFNAGKYFEIFIKLYHNAALLKPICVFS